MVSDIRNTWGQGLINKIFDANQPTSHVCNMANATLPGELAEYKHYVHTNGETPLTHIALKLNALCNTYDTAIKNIKQNPDFEEIADTLFPLAETLAILKSRLDFDDETPNHDGRTAKDILQDNPHWKKSDSLLGSYHYKYHLVPTPEPKKLWGFPINEALIFMGVMAGCTLFSYNIDKKHQPISDFMKNRVQLTARASKLLPLESDIKHALHHFGGDDVSKVVRLDSCFSQNSIVLTDKAPQNQDYLVEFNAEKDTVFVNFTKPSMERINKLETAFEQIIQRPDSSFTLDF